MSVRFDQAPLDLTDDQMGATDINEEASDGQEDPLIVFASRREQQRRVFIGVATGGSNDAPPGPEFVLLRRHHVPFSMVVRFS